MVNKEYEKQAIIDSKTKITSLTSTLSKKVSGEVAEDIQKLICANIELYMAYHHGGEL